MKFGPDDVPVHVLQGQVQVVVGAELLLQQVGDLAGVLVRHSWNRESWHACVSLSLAYQDTYPARRRATPPRRSDRIATLAA